MLDQTPSASPARELRRERIQISAPLLAIAFIFFLTLLIQLALIPLIERFAPDLITRSWFTIAFSSLPMYVIAMPLSILIFRVAKAEAPTAQRTLGFSALCGLIALCFAMTFVGNIIGSIVNTVISLITRKPILNELQELTLATPLWANLLFCGILAPILEEIFFRKLVIDRLRRFGDLPAILISGITFGLIHGNFSQFFYAAGIGLVFGYIYLSTGRLRYSIALHMVVNMIGGVISTEIMRSLDMEAMANNILTYALGNLLPASAYFAYLSFLFACVLLSPLAIVLFWKQIKFQKAQDPLSASDWCAVLLKNPAIWIVAVLIVALFLI